MTYLKKYVYPWFVDMASFASIIGLIIAFVSDDGAVFIALITFCLVLLILLFASLFAVNRVILRNYPVEYKKISSFFIFQCDDGVHSTFETYRLIQCKRPLLTELKYNYRWSGSIPPKISSENQRIEEIACRADDNYNTAIIKFKKPLTFNESAVLHIKTRNDDAKGDALPYLSCKIDTPIDIMQFRVLLAYKPDDYSRLAYVRRRKVNADKEEPYEIVGSVTFNQKYKQYCYILTRPDAGYYYRIDWEK